MSEESAEPISLESAPCPDIIHLDIEGQKFCSHRAVRVSFEKGTLSSTSSSDKVDVGVLFMINSDGQAIHQTLGYQDLMILSAKAAEMAATMQSDIVTH